MSGLRWRPAWGWGASLLGIGLVLLAAQLQILTYASGQDPFTYTRLALDLLQGGMSLAAFRSVADFIIPGWPMVLAGVIQLFGPYAVSWVGFFVCWGAGAGLLRLARKWGLGPAGGLLLAGALLWLVWSGESLYAHFLLYAFRGAPQFLCMVWAFVLLEEADPGRRGGGLRLGLATCVLLAGALIRETVLLALPGMLAWVLLAPAWKNRRWQGAACLLAPLAVLAAGVLVYVLASGWKGNAQFQSWWMFLTQMDAAAYGGRLMEYFRLIAAAAGWPGWMLFALGIWFQRRSPERLLLWIPPALFLAAFYAVFMVHQRYALDCYLLLVVVAAAGLAFAFDVAGRRTAARFRPWILGGGLALMLGLNLQAIRQLPVWGQKIAKAEVERFVQTTWRHVPDPSRLWVDGNCRHLIEVVWTYLCIDPLPPWEDIPAALADGERYFWRLAVPGNVWGSSSDDLIRRRADLVPVADETGAPVEASLGSMAYSLQRVVPWSRHQVEQEWRPDPDEPPLLWLDFQESDPEAERQVRLLAADGFEIHRWTIRSGNGLIPLVVETNRIHNRAGLRVQVESSDVLPSTLIRVPEVNGPWDSFTLERGRLPSAMKWVSAPAHFGRVDDKWGVGITRGAGLTLPLPAVAQNGDVVISFLLEPRFRQNQEVVFHYGIEGSETVSWTNRLNRGRFRHEIPVSMPMEFGYIQVDMTVDVPENWDNHFRLVSIGYQVQ